MRIHNEACRWVQGECTTTVQPRVVETATEMLRKRDKDKDKDKTQSRAEEMQKTRRQWVFLCIHLTQTVTKVLDWKLSLKEGILPGVYRRQGGNLP